MEFLKPYNVANAKKLIIDFENILSDLSNISFFPQRYRDDIKRLFDEYKNYLVRQQAKTTSIDELNKFQTGIRVKALMDDGYFTIDDLRNPTIGQLKEIPGIGQNNAEKILFALNEYKRVVRDNTRVRLSIDDRNPFSESLLTAIYQYKNCKPYVKEAVRVKQANANQISKAIADLQKGNQGLWLFKSDDIKQNAVNAYKFLDRLENSEFVKEAHKASADAWQFNNISKELVWDDFVNNPILFVSILEDIIPSSTGKADVDKDISKYTGNTSISYDKKPKAIQPTQGSISYGTDFVLPKDLEEINLSGLKCTLRKYQENGVKYIIHQKRVMLGDEMGLGKTIQAIASMVALRNTGKTHFLVICPASVLTNWCREIVKHSDLKPIKLHGNSITMASYYWNKDGGVGVATYESIGKAYIESNTRIAMLVVDEAHYIKNPNAKRSQNTIEAAQHSDRLLFMTGTPLENRVEEMIKLIKDLRPDIASKIRRMTFMSQAPEFRNAIAPVYLRRRREDVLSELPELIEYEEWCSMGSKEESAYEYSIMNGSFMSIRRLSWNVDNMSDSSKGKRLLEIVQEAEEEGRKILVFSFFLDTISTVIRWLGNRCMPVINGSVSPAQRQSIIDDFEKAPAGTVLPAQIMAGGTGLNIQSASIVVLCEPQYKPSTEEQAISRAYRMGQTRNVIVYRLLCENTIEERMLERLNLKVATFEAYADESVSGLKDKGLDDKSFGMLVESEKKRITDKNKTKEDVKTVEEVI